MGGGIRGLVGIDGGRSIYMDTKMDGGRQAGIYEGRLISRYLTCSRQAGRSVTFYVYR